MAELCEVLGEGDRPLVEEATDMAKVKDAASSKLFCKLIEDVTLERLVTDGEVPIISEEVATV